MILECPKNDPTRDHIFRRAQHLSHENGNMISGITCFALVFTYVWFGSWSWNVQKWSKTWPNFQKGPCSLLFIRKLKKSEGTPGTNGSRFSGHSCLGRKLIDTFCNWKLENACVMWNLKFSISAQATSAILIFYYKSLLELTKNDSAHIFHWRENHQNHNHHPHLHHFCVTKAKRSKWRGYEHCSFCWAWCAASLRKHSFCYVFGRQSTDWIQRS